MGATPGPTLTIRIEVVVVEAPTGGATLTGPSEPGLAVYADTACVPPPGPLPDASPRRPSARVALLGVAAVVGLVGAAVVFAPGGGPGGTMAAPREQPTDAAPRDSSAVTLPPAALPERAAVPVAAVSAGSSCDGLAPWPAGAQLAVGIGPP